MSGKGQVDRSGKERDGISLPAPKHDAIACAQQPKKENISPYFLCVCDWNIVDFNFLILWTYPTVELFGMCDFSETEANAVSDTSIPLDPMTFHRGANEES